tara:strand:- start:438 stop:611 length:174 start_codon:yes stop_codon:yes gene_type:complete
MINSSPVRTALTKGKTGLSHNKNDATGEKKKPKIKTDTDKGDHGPAVELDSPTSVTL